MGPVEAAFYDGHSAARGVVQVSAEWGADLIVLRPQETTDASIMIDGGYGEGRWIRQALCNPPSFDGNHVIVGSWVVGDEPAGMSLREDAGRITRDTSRFVPHFIRD